MSFNNKVQSVPTNIVAGMFNFKTAEFFQVESAEERAVPQVKF
jgi:LemA protein